MTRAYILSMYEEHGAHNVKVTLNQNDLVELLASYIGEEGPMGGQIDHITEDEFEEMFEAVDSKNLGKFDLSNGWGGFQLHIVELSE